MANSLLIKPDIRNAMIARLLQEGTSSAPVQHWTQGAARVAQALMGGLAEREQEREGREAPNAILDLYERSAQQQQPQPAAMPRTPPPEGFAPLAPPQVPRGFAPPQLNIPNQRIADAFAAGGDTRGSVQPAMAGGDDPTMTIHPRQVAQANNQPMPSPVGVPSPMPPAQAGPMPAQQPAPQPQPQVPAVPPYIRQMLNHPNPTVKAYGAQLMQEVLKPRVPKWEKLDEATLYDQGTGRTLPVGGERRTLIDPAERRAFGIPDDDKRPYQVGPNNRLINPPAETRLTVDQRGEGAFSQSAAKHNAERYNKLVEGGFEAQGMVGDLNALRDIGSRITTGKNAQITAALGPYAELLGVKIDGLDDMQAYQAIISRMAPRMRVAGSGATSDFEMRQFLAALPQLGTTPQGNEIITNTLDAIQQHRVAAADIGSRALAGELSPRDAEKQLRELPNPLELWKKSRGQSPTANPSRATPNKGRTRSGIGWSVD